MSSSGVQGDVRKHLNTLEVQARNAVRKASPWIERLGRFGLAAKGAVYVIVGWLALHAAVRGAMDVEDQQGAMRSVLRQPMGTVLLAVLACGLFAYTTWRLAEAAVNPEREPHTPGGWSRRAFRLGSGIAYGILAVAATRLLFKHHLHVHHASDWVAWLIGKPGGKWLVAATGSGVLVYGLVRVYKATRGELKRQLMLDGYAARARAWILGVGSIGQAARGIVFAVIGTFAFAAGLHANPHEAKGVKEALLFIEQRPYGALLLSLVSLGLIAYGMFQFVEARYRRIRAA
jgi:hypothetical protein